jgi:hypothetical protein
MKWILQNREPGERRAGYSLVEVTLALLVVAIGLVATFGLFPEGLRATRAAVDDTEIALFSEYVFTTLELTAGYYGSTWTIADAVDFKSPALSSNAPPDKFRLEEGKQAVFYWIPDYYGLANGDYAASGLQDFWTSAFTYQLDIINGSWKNLGTPGVVKSVVLKVWPGEYKDGIEPKGDPRIFYREILPFR